MTRLALARGATGAAGASALSELPWAPRLSPTQVTRANGDGRAANAQAQAVARRWSPKTAVRDAFLLRS
jgi:hypothetical protein